MFSAVRGDGFTNDVYYIFTRGTLMGLPTNFIPTVFDQVTNVDFKALVTDPLNGSVGRRVPEFRVYLCVDKNEGVPSIALGTTWGSETREFKRFEKRARFYFDTLCEGHSFTYVAEALRDLGDTNVTLPEGFPPQFEAAYWIPAKWIEKDDMEKGWIVKDGEYAWRYWWSGAEPQHEVRDGLEYDPRFKVAFRTAMEEATSNVLARTEGRRYDYPQALIDEETQDILSRRYNLSWRTPHELPIPH